MILKDSLPLKKYEEDSINNDIITFYLLFNQLKNVYRQGWIELKFGEEGLQKCESVAEHSFSLGLLCMSIIKKYNLQLNMEKCLKMCLLHDLGEIYIGDYTPLDLIEKEEKHRMEEKAVKEILSKINCENDFFEIWKEYENQITEEAIFVRELDKLEFLLQAVAYEMDVSFLKFSISQIKTPIFKEILEDAIDLTKGKELPKSLREE